MCTTSASTLSGFSCVTSNQDFGLFFFARSTLVLHALTTCDLAGHFLDFAKTLALRVSCFTRSLHLLNTLLLLLLAGLLPGFGTSNIADGGLGSKDNRVRTRSSGLKIRRRDQMNVRLLHPSHTVHVPKQDLGCRNWKTLCENISDGRDIKLQDLLRGRGGVKHGEQLYSMTYSTSCVILTRTHDWKKTLFRSLGT